MCMCVYVCACVGVCGLGLGNIENNTQQLLQQSHYDYYHNIALKYFTIINREQLPTATDTHLHIYTH